MSSSCQQLVGRLPPSILGTVRAEQEQEAEAAVELAVPAMALLCTAVCPLTGPWRPAELLFPRAAGSGRAGGMSSIRTVAK